MDVEVTDLPGLTWDIESTPSLSRQTIASLLEQQDFHLEHFVGHSATTASTLSEHDHMVNLSQTFFQQHHHFLPCIHQSSFLSRLNHDTDWADSSPLVWSIMAVAALNTSSTVVQSKSVAWQEKALQLYEQSVYSNGEPLRDLQAAIWIIYLHYRSGHIIKAAMHLSQAYSLACIHGLNRIDDDRKPSYLNVPVKGVIEEEECRSTMWALFILDRQINYLHGLHFVVNDRLFYVNFPAESLALPNSMEAGTRGTEQFRRKLTTFTAPSNPHGVPITQLVQKAVVLLGRIVEYHNIVPLDADLKERADEVLYLQSTVARFWLSLPQSTSNIVDSPPEDLPYAIWINILLHLCSVLLNYPTSVCGKTEGLPSNFGKDADANAGFLRGFKSVQSIIQVVKSTASVSQHLTSNPLLASAYFLCSRFLITRWRQTQEPSHRLDVDLMITLFDRMSDMGTVLAQRYKEIVMRELDNHGPTGSLNHLPIGG
ncbi:hypothetical protein AJ79_03637 [Helicocarpus griseus UAMH5409]|uniref:Xylanolytic transcriptional activator regulatory domain-containing protein n=1 Tax=Helicocarpus griseus UAMH5409 TaxID=1447875 RepID=A0A2B7XYF9_9EURO|nr:hypothetical protein AJ79_03637 [Helicocarpus griseus UAMH5409]